MIPRHRASQLPAILAVALALASCTPGRDRASEIQESAFVPDRAPEKIIVSDFVIPDDLLKPMGKRGADYAELKVGLSVAAAQITADRIDATIVPAERFYNHRQISGVGDWLLMTRVTRFQSDLVPGGRNVRMTCEVGLFLISSGDASPSIAFTVSSGSSSANYPQALGRIAQEISAKLERYYARRAWRTQQDHLSAPPLSRDSAPRPPTSPNVPNFR